ITAVLSPGADPAEVFEFCESLNVAQIELLPVAAVAESASFTIDDLQRYRSFVAGYANDLGHGRKRAALSRFCNMIPRAMGFGIQRYRCGAGRSLYAAGPDGVLYPCFRMIGVPDFEVGSVFSQIDKSALSHFRNTTGRSIMKRTACRACWSQALCNGPCFAVTGLMNIKPGSTSLQCVYTRIDATEVIRLVSKLQKLDPERLLTYLPADLSPVI
ncbi:MAG: SPASM domain-containing protein, partial [Syntrophaceae bacterium]|nr:SPASM domain-containing protein [Syntrophaceae bacterium]